MYRKTNYFTKLSFYMFLSEDRGPQGDPWAGTFYKDEGAVNVDEDQCQRKE